MELDSDLVVSAIKKAEDSDSIVLRMFNPAQQSVSAGKLRLADKPRRIIRSNLSETMTEEVVKAGDLGEASSQKVVTYLITPEDR